MDDRRSRRIAIARVALLAAALVTVAVVAVATGFRPSAGDVRDWGESLGAAGPVLFVPLSIGLAVLLFPGPVLAGAAGLLFGTAIGFPIALLAATLTAVTQMAISRHTAGGQVGALVPERARRIDAGLERRGFVAVLYMRLAPAVPYHLVNYGAGLTRLRMRDMALGTAVGAAPRTFAYVALGGSLDDIGSPAGVAAIVLLVVTAAAGAWLSRREIVAGARRGARTLGGMDYFRFVRLYSAAECVLFASLLVVWIGDLSPDARLVLGWAHGFGWIFLCLMVLYGWVRRIFPGPLLAATVSPLGPLGALLGFEVLRLRRKRELVS
jgi:uncharacterized membrane protein YdjX (TVP38/TMEM64 family)